MCKRNPNPNARVQEKDRRGADRVLCVDLILTLTTLFRNQTDEEQIRLCVLLTGAAGGFSGNR